MFLFKTFSKIPFFSLQKFITKNFATNIYPTVAVWKDFTEEDLSNPKKVKNILKSHVLPRRSARSQQGLYHKKRVQTGNQTCFSEKKTRRKWKPNIRKRNLYSKVLDKTFRMEITSKAEKCMRKYGGFDNYILMTEPKNLDSKYGEYIRKLLLLKLNNEDFKVPYITRTKKFSFKSSRKIRRMKFFF